MKIHITKAGKAGLLIIALIIAIGLCILLIYKACTVIPKKIENHRVNSIPKHKSAFENNDITYNDMNSLRQSYKRCYDDIAKVIGEIKKLKQDYPENQLLQTKLTTYEQYLQSMREAFFECPEHNTKSTTTSTKTCRKCKGRGKGKFLRWVKCKKCRGKGTITSSTTTTYKCPNCKSMTKSQIKGETLLN